MREVEDKSLFRSFFLGFSRKKRRLCIFTKSSMFLNFLIQFLGFLRISVFALFRVFSGLHRYPYNIKCHGANWIILKKAIFFILRLLRSVAPHPSGESQFAPHFRFFLFPFSGSSFSLFSFLFLFSHQTEMRKAVFFSSEVTGRLSPSSKTGFSSVVFLLYPPYLLSFQRFSTRSRGLCTRFLFPDFLWFFSLVSEERAEKEPIKEKRIALLRVVGKTKYSLNPRVMTATKKDQGQAR